MVFKFKRTVEYGLEEVYGMGEIPPEDCPTYIERDAHQSFKYTVQHEEQHIVVYGASRQGKTWLIERFSPNFIRVGCDSKFTREGLFKAILHELKVVVGEVQESSGNEVELAMGASAKGNASIPLVAKVGLEGKGEYKDKDLENRQVTYENIDLTNQTEVISAIKDTIGERFIVIENFHYLDSAVQKTFASSLREFLYHEIRVIIVGVWKETTKLTSLVSDLSNRVESIDIGDWNVGELKEIVNEGDKALKVKTDEVVKELFIENSGRNVGIFKSLLKNYCKLCGVYSTQPDELYLNDIEKAKKAIDKSFDEVVYPAIDRVHKLASSRKSGGKGLRYYIIKAILDIMSVKTIDELIGGIVLLDIVKKIEEYDEEQFQPSNIKQELIQLHLREETVEAEGSQNVNFIPLFYFDRNKDRLFIVESALFSACRSSKIKLNELLGPKADYVK
ncbi:hypothetical protein ABES02_07495 [Neobacillus pocheonensis]|uniref:hypothetical protein n=1 Tax=Neobacillus pocheonensis TaxID=363869 RepID=UPI003D2E4D93